MVEGKKKYAFGFLIVIILGVTGYGIYSSVTDTVFLSFGSRWIYTDTQGREIEVPTDPQRIVSMSPSITEAIFAVDGDDNLVGRTDYCNYPAEALDIESIGGFSTPDLEKLTALNPDLIISATYNAESVSTLEESGFIIVIVEAGNSILSIIDSIKDIGRLVGEKSKGEEVANNMLDKYNNIVEKTSTISSSEKLSCYFEVWESPMVVGNQSYINDMIESAGAINIFADVNEEYPIVSNENVINGNPDVIFLTEHSAAWYSQELCTRTGYDSINACINDRVYSVNDDLYLRPGPRVVDALENMTNLLYPELL